MYATLELTIVESFFGLRKAETKFERSGEHCTVRAKGQDAGEAKTRAQWSHR